MFSDLTKPILIASVVEAVFYSLLALAIYKTPYYFNSLPTVIQDLLPIFVAHMVIYPVFCVFIAYIFDKISRA